MIIACLGVLAPATLIGVLAVREDSLPGSIVLVFWPSVVLLREGLFIAFPGVPIWLLVCSLLLNAALYEVVYRLGSTAWRHLLARRRA